MLVKMYSFEGKYNSLWIIRFFLSHCTARIHYYSTTSFSGPSDTDFCINRTRSHNGHFPYVVLSFSAVWKYHELAQKSIWKTMVIECAILFAWTKHTVLQNIKLWHAQTFTANISFNRPLMSDQITLISWIVPVQTWSDKGGRTVTSLRHCFVLPNSL